MSPATRSNVSPGIQAVAAKFADKASDTVPSNYTINPMPNKSSSPERSLVKGHYHKRMQSLQPADTKGDARSEFLNYLESRSPERPLRATIVDPTIKSQDTTKIPSDPSRPKTADRELPSFLSSRYLSKPILGESTPTSATMLAIQNMQLPPESDPLSPSKPPKMIADRPAAEPQGHTMDTLATQIHSLTDIASNLQREMANLSRRSKDNATDLISLKAATNARDEDIRKSLKDLSSNLTSKLLDGDLTRLDLSALLKPGDGPNSSEPDSSPNSKRSYSVPRMPSPNPFSFDRDLCGSPAPISDGSASIALLEKVLREMATKEGEERLLELVDEIKSRPSATASGKDADTKITKMLEEILNLVKQDPSSNALVRSLKSREPSQSNDPNAESARSASVGSIMDPTATVRALDVPKGDRALAGSENMLPLLQSVKNSVMESGGMTNSVKALVRELRGEVLGMGRDIARKLEAIESSRENEEPQEQPQHATPQEIAAVVNDSLHDLRDQLAATINESRQQSSDLAQIRAAMNSAEIYAAVKKALDEFEIPQPEPAEPHGPIMEKEDILETVREAWETYKPEIELQNFGLERDEILDCLSEGLKDYQPKHQQSLTYEKVLAAVQTGLQNYVPPPVEHPPTITRDEIILTIRECLEKPEPTSRSLDDEHVQHLHSMREELLHAIAERAVPEPSRGLDEEDIQHLHAMREEILHAIAERPAPDISSRGLDEEHIHHLHSVRDEILNAIAERATPDQSSRGLNEEHVHHLNEIRDEILNALTGSMATQSMLSRESYDSGLGRDEIVSAVSDGLEAHFTTAKDVEEPRISRADVVNAVNDAFSAQHTALTIGNDSPLSREEIMAAIADGIEMSQKPQEASISREEIMAAIADGIEMSQKSEESALVPNVQPSLSREEIVEAVSEALEKSQVAQKSALSTDVQQPSITREELFAAVVDGIESSNTMTREIELNKDDLMEAISAGLQDASSAANLNVGDQVMGRLQEVVDGMKEEFKQYSAANGRDTEQVLDAIKDGLEVVRREIESYVATASEVSGKHEIIDTVKEGFRLLQADMEKTINDASLSNAVRAAPDTTELLDAMEKEFEHLRGTIGTLLVKENAASDKDEILDAIRDVSEQSKTKGADEEVLNTLRAEFENMRERMDLSMSVVRAEPGSDKDDIIAALREHFDNLREETLSKKDGAESTFSATSELLDAFHDNMDAIRDDLKKLMDKPTDFDTSEILDTIKDGLADLKLDIDSIRQSQKETDDAETTRGDELMLAKEAAFGNDIDRLKSLITELQSKVESIDSTPRAAESVEDALKRSDLDEVLMAVQEVQVAMGALGDMGASQELHEFAARKEDTDAIQEILMSTKAQIDDIVFPSPDEIATSQHISTLETMIGEAKESIADLSSRIEADAPTKAEIGALEGLIKDVFMALEELKTKTKEAEEVDEEADTDKLMKSDLQTVEAMIFEVKTQVDELKLPDVETLPTKEEIQELSALVTDFREKMEANNEMTAQGFEARKVEHGGLAEKIEEAKFVVGELGDELKSKLDGSAEGLTELKTLLEGLAITAENFSTVESIKELTDLINREFERARGEEDASKLDKEERDAATMVKHDETRAAIIVELGAKIDEKIAEVMAKYDDAHTSLHSKFSECEERDMAHTEAVTSTKGLAEEIKLVIGEMGTSVNETCERIGVDTKALFEKVDESYNRMEEMQNEVKTQQEQSRGETERAAAATERVESKLLEFHPQILETVQQILEVVNQHYDHSQKSTEEVKSELSALPSTIPTMLPALPPPESSRDLDDDPVHNKLNDLLEHAKNNQVQEVITTLLDHSKNDQLHAKLDRLLDRGSGNEEIYEKLNQIFDHAASGSNSVHEKLDALLERPAPSNSENSVTQMMKLDEMHKDIMENARRMNEMFAAQSVIVAEDTERKRREAEDAAIALERRVAQREQVEAEIVGLHEEKDSLLKMLHTLKAEKDELAKQNTKLSKEVSGLETALEIRHEEMQQMEERADGLEKRILEGVLDHARSVLLSRSGSVHGMSLKRNRSTRSSRARARSPRSPSVMSAASTARDSKDARSLLGNGVGMALKRRTPASLQAGAAPIQPNIGKERRILSLSHVTGNRGVDRQVSANSGITSLKRSHSVKSNFALRKTSLPVRTSMANKENEAFHEEDEPESEVESHAGTERRSSYAPTDRKTSYAETCTDSMCSGVTESVASTDRRTSGMSIGTVDASTVDGHEYVAASSIADDDQSYVSGNLSGSEDDDARTAREDDDENDEEEAKDPETEDEYEAHDSTDRPISDTASAVEAEVMKVLEPAGNSALGTESAVSAA
jgi:DNA repair exonuclease SbcCD ATPase subunit